MVALLIVIVYMFIVVWPRCCLLWYGLFLLIVVGWLRLC